MSESKAKVMGSMLCFAGALLINFSLRCKAFSIRIHLNSVVLSECFEITYNVEHSFNYVMNNNNTRTPTKSICHFTSTILHFKAKPHFNSHFKMCSISKFCNSKLFFLCILYSKFPLVKCSSTGLICSEVFFVVCYLCVCKTPSRRLSNPKVFHGISILRQNRFALGNKYITFRIFRRSSAELCERTNVFAILFIFLIVSNRELDLN